MSIIITSFVSVCIASTKRRSCGEAIHTNTNDVIIIDTILFSLAPPQLHPMTDYHKIIFGSSIYNTSKYFQESLDAWR